MIFEVSEEIIGIAMAGKDNPLIKQYEQYCAEQGINCRLHLGNGLAFSPKPWPDENAANIDIVFYGSNNFSFSRMYDYVPDVLGSQLLAEPIPFRNIQNERARPDTLAIYDANGMYYAEVTDSPRVLYFAFNPFMTDTSQLNFSAMLDPIQSAFEFQYVPDIDSVLESLTERISRNMERRVEELKQTITGHENNVRAYQRSVANEIANLRVSAQELTALTDTEIDNSDLVSQMEVIARHPMIIDGSVCTYQNDENQIVVAFDTVELHIHDEDQEIDLPLGKFRIELLPYDCYCFIRNITNAKQGRDHPHISEGEPCFAGYQKEFDAYMNAGQYSACVEFLLGYLQTYNPEDDWGRYINYWR